MPDQLMTKDEIRSRMSNLRCTYFSPNTTDEERVVLKDEYDILYDMLPLQEAQGFGSIIGHVFPFRPDPTEAEIAANIRRIRAEAAAGQQAGEA